MSDIFDNLASQNQTAVSPSSLATPQNDVFDNLAAQSKTSTDVPTGDIFNQLATQPSATTASTPPPVSSNDDSLLTRFKSVIEGTGTWLGPETAGPTFEQIAHEPLSTTWQKEKDAMKAFLDTSAIVPSNAITPGDVASHPHVTAAAQGASDVIKNLTTPGSLAMIIGTEGLGAIPKYVEGAMSGVETLAPYAARTAKITQKSLQALGVYFTADQIADVIQSVPEVAQAAIAGQTDKAIRLATGAIINGAVATHFGAETRRSILGSVDEAKQNSAIANKEYADTVHDIQKTLQVGGGQKEQIADLGREVFPDAKDREWVTEYAEANQNRNILKKRQEETKVGPQPSEQIEAAQGNQLPLEETKPISADTEKVPSVPEITYREDNNGTRWAKTPDSPAEISVPKDLEGEAADKYVTEKINLQKEYAKKNTLVSPAVTEQQGLFSEEAKEKASAPASGESSDFTSPAAQEALGLQAALKDAADAAKAHVITPEERAKMVEQQDPTKKITPKQQKAVDFVISKMDYIKQEAQKRGLLPQGQLRENFVPHEYDFEDSSDPTRRRLYDTYHDAQQAGLVAKNKDFFALTSDYIEEMTRKIADYDAINNLKSGRTKDGRPLAVPGGFVEGQRVSQEGPQSYVMEQQAIDKLKREGQFNNLIRKGQIVQNPDKSFTMKADDFVKAKNLYETRPIGPTPIPPKILEEMKSNGSLDALEQRGLVYKNDKGEYINKEPLYARVPVYLHPDIAEHFNDVVKPKIESPTTGFGRLGKLYDDTTGNMKSLLLSWSPFHRVTESMRMMESLGIVKGAKLAAQTNLGLAPKIDYFNLKPWQEAAIRDGIVTADPRGKSMSNVEEGLSAGENTWGSKTYKLFDKGLEKLGVPTNIRDQINLQDILTKNVFGPQGMITQAKFEMYQKYKPDIVTQMAKDHPDWSPWEVDKQAGRQAAEFANNKFGGLNQVTLGRTLQDQKWLRRVLLAPDFLEATGRSVLDLGKPYGDKLVSNLIKFNVAHALTAAGINYALHHDPNDNSVKGAVDATHLLDHPYEVIGPDNKTAYGLRTTATDFLHMLRDPREFAYDRVNPALRAADEVMEQRNQYGRRESLREALKAVPKATLPIQVQNAVGLGPSTTTEPSATDQVLKSLGIQARPNRTPAEDLAIRLVSQNLEGQKALTGSALVKKQLKFNAEDKLRAAYLIKDPERKKTAIVDAKHDIDNLAGRKIIDANEKNKIMTDAHGSRLKSIFNSLPTTDPTDVLDIWNKATDDEKKELGVMMNAKYQHWLKDIENHGANIRNLNSEDQQTLNQFRQASSEWRQILERPEPPVSKTTE